MPRGDAEAADQDRLAWDQATRDDAELPGVEDPQQPLADPGLSRGVAGRRWRLQELRDPAEFKSCWNKVDVLVCPVQKRAEYLVGFASSDPCLEEVQRLRYQVFNVELHQGLASSRASGLDRDEFDEQMTHLVVLDRSASEIVGTYRLQTARQARAGRGFYSAHEFDLAGLDPYLDEAVELGRACTAAQHRRASALFAMWFGLHEYVRTFGLRWLFGCCSINSTDPDDGWRAMKTIREKGHLHPEVLLPVREQGACGDASRELDADLGPALCLPKLFRAYLHLGARVISHPCIDREFGTIDFLILTDAHNVNLSSLEVLR